MTLSDGVKERRSEHPRKWKWKILAAQLRSHALLVMYDFLMAVTNVAGSQKSMSILIAFFFVFYVKELVSLQSNQKCNRTPKAASPS